MRDNHDTTQTQAANAVLSPAAPVFPKLCADGGIRADRVAGARARLAAGLIPLSAEDLADAIIRDADRSRLCRD